MESIHILHSYHQHFLSWYVTGIPNDLRDLKLKHKVIFWFGIVQWCHNSSTMDLQFGTCCHSYHVGSCHYREGVLHGVQKSEAIANLTVS